jgi:hypothetical protein
MSEQSLVFRPDVWKAKCYVVLCVYLTAQLTNEVYICLPQCNTFVIKKTTAIKSGKKCAIRESQTTEYTEGNLSTFLNSGYMPGPYSSCGSVL